jgi:hypothetical protein
VSEHGDAPAEVSLPGVRGEVALLTAIDVALNARPGELPGRVGLIRHYLGAALEAAPGSRSATYKVLAQLIVRDLSQTGRLAGQERP